MTISFNHKFFLNGFILVIPVLIWNIVLAGQLPLKYQPEIFWNEIPLWMSMGEHGFRISMFVLICFIRLKDIRDAKTGYVIYLSGLLIYFLSWTLLMLFPESGWTKSFAGFMAPAYTPVIWLIGIALVSRQYYFNLRFVKWLFPTVMILFLLFHNMHAGLIFYR